MFEDVIRWLQNVCRTCIVEYDVLHDISEIKDRSYLEFVESFADVIINCGDGIPNKLCSNCMEKLQTCIDFKVQIQKSDLYLRSKLNNTHISNENDHFTTKDIEDNDDKDAIFLSEEHSNGSSVCRDKNIDEAIQNELGDVERICEVGIKSEDDYEELDNPLRDILLRKSESSIAKTSHKRKVSKGHITKKGRWNLRAKRTILKEVELKEEVSSDEEEEKKQWVPKAKIKSDKSPYSYIKTEKHRVEFPCNMCIKVFPNETQLDIHMATHDPNKPFICNLLRCRRQFATEKEFMVHQAVNHSKDLVCPVCNKQFSAKHNMRQHMVSHRESKRHKCNVCGKGFNYRNHLKNHELIHTPKDDTPHLCQQCGKKFRSKENFRQHMLRHRTTKPHKCLFCPKTFILPTYLRLHMKRHTGENDFLCQTCGKQLFSQVNLKKHVKSHLPGGVPDVEEERHLCGICVRSFKKKAAFEVHMKTHESGARVHKCDHCSWYFTSTSLMRDHVKNRHSNIMKPPRKRGVEVFPKNVSQEELAIANASTLVHSTAATTHANKLKLKLQHKLANLTDTDVHAHTDSQYEQVIPIQDSPVNIAPSPDSNASNSVNTVMMGQYVRLSDGEPTTHCVMSEHSEESNNSFINNQGNSNDMQPEQIHYTTITICPDGGENQYAIVIKK